MTEGCIALTNEEIDEIYSSVKDGVIIEINP
jgi:lipoprotein-anchoring transpeptidase ErfK/SrfK